MKRLRLVLVVAVLGILPGLAQAGRIIWPCSGSVTSKYGPRTSPCSGCSNYHHGIDIGVGSGTNLGAPGNGTVQSYVWSSCGGNIHTTSYGNGWTTRFLHCSASVVGAGTPVSRNTTIARSGNTGSCTTGAHLHFEVRKDGASQMIPGNVGNWVTRGNEIAYEYAGLNDSVRKAPSMFYRTGASSLNIFRWASSGTAFSLLPTTGISSGYGLDNVGQHMVSVDVNGDGADDNVLAYQYSNGTMRLHVFLNGSWYQGDAGWFQSGTFNMANVNGRMVGGDFNGDGKGDVAMLYASGGGVKVFRFLSTGSSFNYDSITIASGYSMSSVDDNVAAADVNGDGKDDLVVAYQYGDGTWRLHVFLNANSYQGPGGWFQGGIFNLDLVNGRMVGGDFNGDGKGDVALLYDNGGGVTVYRFTSTGSSFSYSTGVISSGYNLDNVGKNVAAGDINGNGTDDIAVAYQYPDGTFRYHVFVNGISYAGPNGYYQSGNFNLDNVSGRMSMGKW